ncbi:MAG: RluA family pseudouridine synthase [Pseudomonadota bacterium]
MSERLIRELEVPPALGGERADRAAAQLFDEFSRAVLSRWINEGALTVDGSTVKPRHRLLGGEVLRLDADLDAGEDWASAQPVAFEVVHEDEDVLVIHKPAGLVVHPGAGNADGTLVNGLLAHRRELTRLPRAGIVHRLDKHTSGLMVVAASLPAHAQLVRDLEARTVERRYLAITEGRMVGGRDIDAPIGRDAQVRTRQQVRDDGKPAQTRVRVRARYRVHTLIEAALQTGRTHQIRVHLSSIGYPLVGDKRYGARGRLPPGADAVLIDCLQQFPRQALHAWRLAFTHPTSGEFLTFETELPADMRLLRTRLEEDAETHGES